MTVHTPFYAFPSALTQEECNKIINLGLKKNQKMQKLLVKIKEMLIEKLDKQIKQHNNYKMN